MISLRTVSLVISVVLLRQVALQAAGQGSDQPQLQSQFHWLVGGCVLFCVIAKFLPVIAMFRADVVSRQLAWMEMERKRQWLEWSWLVAQGWLLVHSDTAARLAQAENRGAASALMLIAWFLPTFIFYAALEFGFTQLECLWSREGDVSSQAHWSRWTQRVRLGNLGQIITCLAPVILLLSLLDLVQYSLPQLPEVTQAMLALTCLALFCLGCAPLWLQFWSGARSLSATDSLSKRVRELSQQLGVRAPRVCSVGEGHTWHGVALVGWTPLFRQIWMGPAVVRCLTLEQLDMVLLHELAHLRRGHCWWRTIPVVIAGASFMGMLWLWPISTNWEWNQLTCSLVFAVAMLWMLSRISRYCELDADKHACRWAARHCEWTDGQPDRAMNTLAEALRTLHDPSEGMQTSTWLHLR